MDGLTDGHDETLNVPFLPLSLGTLKSVRSRPRGERNAERQRSGAAATITKACACMARPGLRRQRARAVSTRRHICKPICIIYGDTTKGLSINYVTRFGLFSSAARGRPIIVEWERDARHSAGLSR
ncbi:hypothetical protein EVAR_93463_1 [Eumeta japonica]|uniref:Uncharacterized protein n=1 Tax=Eumeta variegata TaxID=151549 RepID=A0A4C1TLW8_EUMVA|nr:hypothetical protein EVAR_93463_1 [Eumeta japonica]